MTSRKLAGAGAAAIGAATAVTALLLGSTTAVAQESRPESAYGLSASGLLSINPVPRVESADGSPEKDQLVGLGDVLGKHEGDLAAGVLTVEARRGSAETSVAEIDVLGLLSADLVRTYCDDGDGGLQIIGGSVLGQKLPENPVPGQVIDVSPLVRLELGAQSRNADGSITVTGIELSVLPAAKDDPDEPLDSQDRKALPVLGGLLGANLAGTDTVGDVVGRLTGTLGIDLSDSLQTVTIGSATCAPYGDDGDRGDAADRNDEPSADPAPADEPTADTVPAAPKPEIVESDLPVTG